MNYREAVDNFLASDIIAVAGVSSSDKKAPANLIFHKLKAAGYHVFAVNPAVDSVEGTRSYPDLAALPEKPQAVIIAGPSSATQSLVQQCIDLGIGKAWIHSSLGPGSYDEEAVAMARQKGLTIIPTGCPMMFVKPVDFPHKCFRTIFQWTGKIPQEV